MEEQIDKILNDDWDVLIVLDTCRYDIFQNYNFLEGDLKKVHSVGSNTYEFCSRVFGQNSEKFEDVEIISANPHINSYGLPNAEFKPENKFKKIYDVWKKTDDDNITRPEYVLDKFEEVREEDQKYILWFMQPHFPYLNYPCCMASGIGRDDIGRFDSLRVLKEKLKNLYKMEDILPFYICKTGWSIWNTIIGLAGIRKTIANHGRLASLNGYIYSLNHVLKLINDFDFEGSKVIITGDHGDSLTWKERREFGFLGHPRESDASILREVPWLVME